MAKNLLQSTDLHTVPGWYRDPTADADQRFWDGAHWTLLTRDNVSVSSDLTIDGLDLNDMRIDDLEIDDIQLNDLQIHLDSPPHTGRRSTDPVDGPVAADSADDKPSLFEVSSGAERRVVRLEPAVAELPQRRRKDDVKPARSLFEDRDGPAAPSFAPLVDEAPEPRAARPAGPLATKPAAKPAEPAAKTPKNRPPSYPRNRAAVANRSRRRLQLLALALGASGLAIGYVSGSADDERVALEAEKSLTESVNSRVAASGRPGEVIVLERELQVANQEAQVSGDELGEVLLETDELREQLADATAELDDAVAEVEQVTEHNELLITWFTDDLVARGQTEWDNEVARACALVEDGALLSSDLLTYTRSMELIGTESGLYRAVAACAIQ